MGFNYTIVIPHKNTPDLLQKCIDSVPVRDDVQVVIVDDNSDPSIVDFDHFPGYGRENVRVIFNKEPLGAGHARNLALDVIADTRWLVFSDSDDYFTSYLGEAFDKYLDDDSDMIMFKRDSVFVGTNKSAGREKFINGKVDEAQNNNDFNIIRYKIPNPMCKFIKYDIVKRNNIKFEVVPFSNDVMFFIHLGPHLKSIKIDNNSLYVITVREGSLTRTNTYKSVSCRFKVAVEAIQFLESIGMGKYHPNIFSYCYFYSKLSIVEGFKCFFNSLYHTPIKYWMNDISMCCNHFLHRGYKIEY